MNTEKSSHSPAKAEPAKSPAPAQPDQQKSQAAPKTHEEIQKEHDELQKKDAVDPSAPMEYGQVVPERSSGVTPEQKAKDAQA